jgi:RND family efflux transporter MFP subunit
MLSRTLRKVLPLLIVGVAILVAKIMIESRAELPRRPLVTSSPVVSTVRAEPGPVRARIISRGNVIPQRQISLIAELSGRIVWVAPEFVTGGRVAADAPLLRIDPIDYEVAVSAAEAAVASAELGLAEVKVLIKRAAIEEAESRLVAARDSLRKARADLAKTEVRAPFNAVIDSRHVDFGQYVSRGVVLMSLLGTDVAEVRLPVLGAELPFLRVGADSAGTWPQATLSAQFGAIRQEWTARLQRLENRVDSQTRVYYLVAAVDAPYALELHGQALTVGLFVDAEIEGTAVENAVRLPRSSLHAGNHVFVLDAGVLRRREVHVVRQEEGTVIVDEGLAAGDEVVTTRLDLMVDGMSVSVAGAAG